MTSLADFLETRWQPYCMLSTIPCVYIMNEHDQNKANILFDGGCCILEIEVREDHMTISLEELMISRRKSDCNRSGNDYLQLLHLANNDFWSKKENYEGFSYRYVKFKVSDDLATIVALPAIRCTDEDVSATHWLSESEFGRSNILASMISMEELLAEHRIRLFFSKILQEQNISQKAIRHDEEEYKEISGLSIYSGRILVADFAYICLHISQTTSPIFDRFVQRLWYEYILPRVLEKIEVKSFPPSRFDCPELSEFKIKLATITLLGRDDARTWYMDKLQLSVCALNGQPIEHYTRRLEEFRLLPVKSTFSSVHVRDVGNMPVKNIVLIMINNLRKKQFTYFDAIMYTGIINSLFAFERGLIIHAFISDVCRVLVD